MPETPKFAEGTLFSLESYDWPGNVRELENLIERALIRRRGITDGTPLSFDDLFFSLSDAISKDIKEENDVFYSLDELNARYIRKILKHTRGKISGPNGASEILGVNVSTLRSRMKKLGISFRRGKG